ncbi:MAG: hypothetical protein KDC95_04210 [Planctomycetes bacterium]|nr:hypothetical protein [Planctomycetota bacterium]
MSIAVASCMLLFVAACQLFLGKGGKSELVFPHGPHVEELDCSDCHEGAEEGTAAGFPATDNGCRLCHKDLDEGKPFEKTVDAFMIDGKPRWLARGTASNGDVKFDHSKHYEAELECDACHAADIDLDASTKGLRIAGGKKTCLECHEKTDRGNDCAVCHEVLRHDVAPPSHAMDWKRLHGSESRHMIDGLGQTTCAQCHEDTVESCSKCHQREMPESHNNFWRIRGHSLLASNDRQLCATCHQPDHCLACHRSTRPRSHRGAFGPPGNRHCVGCHVEPAAKAGCTVCHQEPMHPLGNSIPGNTAHQRAKSPFDCMSCHVALKHANPGIDCRACHK